MLVVRIDLAIAEGLGLGVQAIKASNKRQQAGTVRCGRPARWKLKVNWIESHVSYGRASVASGYLQDPGNKWLSQWKPRCKWLGHSLFSAQGEKIYIYPAKRLQRSKKRPLNSACRALLFFRPHCRALNLLPVRANALQQLYDLLPGCFYFQLLHCVVEMKRLVKA